MAHYFKITYRLSGEDTRKCTSFFEAEATEARPGWKVTLPSKYAETPILLESITVFNEDDMPGPTSVQGGRGAARADSTGTGRGGTAGADEGGLMQNNWTPYNTVGKRISVTGRAASIIAVLPPRDKTEVERIVVRYDDDGTEATLPVRGVRIGEDWIR
jgi:hypothetical protein